MGCKLSSVRPNAVQRREPQRRGSTRRSSLSSSMTPLRSGVPPRSPPIPTCGAAGGGGGAQTSVQGPQRSSSDIFPPPDDALEYDLEAGNDVAPWFEPVSLVTPNATSSTTLSPDGGVGHGKESWTSLKTDAAQAAKEYQTLIQAKQDAKLAKALRLQMEIVDPIRPLDSFNVTHRALLGRCWDRRAAGAFQIKYLHFLLKTAYKKSTHDHDKAGIPGVTSSLSQRKKMPARSHWFSTCGIYTQDFLAPLTGETVVDHRGMHDVAGRHSLRRLNRVHRPKLKTHQRGRDHKLGALNELKNHLGRLVKVNSLAEIDLVLLFHDATQVVKLPHEVRENLFNLITRLTPSYQGIKNAFAFRLSDAVDETDRGTLFLRKRNLKPAYGVRVVRWNRVQVLNPNLNALVMALTQGEEWQSVPFDSSQPHSRVHSVPVSHPRHQRHHNDSHSKPPSHTRVPHDSSHIYPHPQAHVSHSHEMKGVLDAAGLGKSFIAENINSSFTPADVSSHRLARRSSTGLTNTTTTTSGFVSNTRASRSKESPGHFPDDFILSLVLENLVESHHNTREAVSACSSTPCRFRVKQTKTPLVEGWDSSRGVVTGRPSRPPTAAAGSSSARRVRAITSAGSSAACPVAPGFPDSHFILLVVANFQVSMDPFQWKERHYTRYPVDFHVHQHAARREFGEGIITDIMYGGLICVECSSTEAAEELGRVLHKMDWSKARSAEGILHDVRDLFSARQQNVHKAAGLGKEVPCAGPKEAPLSAEGGVGSEGSPTQQATLAGKGGSAGTQFWYRITRRIGGLPMRDSVEIKRISVFLGADEVQERTISIPPSVSEGGATVATGAGGKGASLEATPVAKTTAASHMPASTSASGPCHNSYSLVASAWMGLETVSAVLHTWGLHLLCNPEYAQPLSFFLQTFSGIAPALLQKILPTEAHLHEVLSSASSSTTDDLSHSATSADGFIDFAEYPLSSIRHQPSDTTMITSVGLQSSSLKINSSVSSQSSNDRILAPLPARASAGATTASESKTPKRVMRASASTVHPLAQPKEASEAGKKTRKKTQSATPPATGTAALKKKKGKAPVKTQQRGRKSPKLFAPLRKRSSPAEHSNLDLASGRVTPQLSKTNLFIPFPDGNGLGAPSVITLSRRSSKIFRRAADKQDAATATGASSDVKLPLRPPPVKQYAPLGSSHTHASSHDGCRSSAIETQRALRVLSSSVSPARTARTQAVNFDRPSPFSREYDLEELWYIATLELKAQAKELADLPRLTRAAEAAQNTRLSELSVLQRAFLPRTTSEDLDSTLLYLATAIFEPKELPGSYLCLSTPDWLPQLTAVLTSPKNIIPHVLVRTPLTPRDFPKLGILAGLLYHPNACACLECLEFDATALFGGTAAVAAAVARGFRELVDPKHPDSADAGGLFGPPRSRLLPSNSMEMYGKPPGSGHGFRDRFRVPFPQCLTTWEQGFVPTTEGSLGADPNHGFGPNCPMFYVSPAQALDTLWLLLCAIAENAMGAASPLSEGSSVLSSSNSSGDQSSRRRGNGGKEGRTFRICFHGAVRLEGMRTARGTSVGEREKLHPTAPTRGLAKPSSIFRRVSAFFSGSGPASVRRKSGASPDDEATAPAPELDDSGHFQLSQVSLVLEPFVSTPVVPAVWWDERSATEQDFAGLVVGRRTPASPLSPRRSQTPSFCCQFLPPPELQHCDCAPGIPLHQHLSLCPAWAHGEQRVLERPYFSIPYHQVKSPGGVGYVNPYNMHHNRAGFFLSSARQAELTQLLGRPPPQEAQGKHVVVPSPPPPPTGRETEIDEGMVRFFGLADPREEEAVLLQQEIELVEQAEEVWQALVKIVNAYNEPLEAGGQDSKNGSFAEEPVPGGCQLQRGATRHSIILER